MEGITLFDVYRVLLPDWVFEDESNVKTKAEQYLQRYPHYYLVDIKEGFAICEIRV